LNISDTEMFMNIILRRKTCFLSRKLLKQLYTLPKEPALGFPGPGKMLAAPQSYLLCSLSDGMFFLSS
jgi:hypothetical protein